MNCSTFIYEPYIIYSYTVQCSNSLALSSDWVDSNVDLHCLYMKLCICGLVVESVYSDRTDRTGELSRQAIASISYPFNGPI